MKKLLIILGITITILVISIAGYFAFLRSPSSGPSKGSVFDPFSNVLNTGGNSYNVPIGELTPVTLTDGSIIQAKNFVNADQYEGASAEYGLTVGDQQDTASFDILYYPNDSGFLISLLSEPLGEARLEAEAELKRKLSVTPSEFCKLRVEVFTSIDVNETFAGRNLGLSACTGSIRLP